MTEAVKYKCKDSMIITITVFLVIAFLIALMFTVLFFSLTGTFTIFILKYSAAFETNIQINGDDVGAKFFSRGKFNP